MLIIDVTIVDPLNKTNIARAGTHARKHQHNSTSESAAAASTNNSNDNMVATKYAEGEKAKKYKRLVEENEATLLTAAVESTGGFGKQFREILKFVSLTAQQEDGGWEAGEISSGIRCAARWRYKWVMRELWRRIGTVSRGRDWSVLDGKREFEWVRNCC